MYINRTKVVAIVPWMRQMEAGRRYLMFVKFNPADGRMVVGPSGVYEFMNDGFRSLMAGGSTDDLELGKQSQADVVVSIRNFSQ